MNNVSKRKIAAGYTLLLAALFSALFFVQREVDTLLHTNHTDTLLTDTLLTLLGQKDANTISLLHTLMQMEGQTIPTAQIKQIIAQQDTAATQQRVQRRVVTHRDTIVTPPKKRGFLRRLGDVFTASKPDTTIRVKSTEEVATDTLLRGYNPTDTLHQQLRQVAQTLAPNPATHRQHRRLQRADRLLTLRIDTLLRGYEQHLLHRARAQAQQQQAVRGRSTRIIGGIAAGAVLLSAIFLVIIGRDVTRSNRYRRQLEEARRRAEELLAVREKLMLAITHDFKAPLSSIIGYANLLTPLASDERQRLYLDAMKTSSQHLLKLVVDLLDFHRLDLKRMELNRATFRPCQLLEEICATFQPLAGAKGLQLLLSIDPQLQDSALVSDPLRLRQVLSNLLSNAVKFTQHGSITLAATYQDRQLLISVADTGRGMEAGHQERIFQEFTRLPNAQGEEGFGLGLSIVRMLVQLLGATIQVDSTLNQGSTFTLSIPAPVVNIPSSTPALPPASLSLSPTYTPLKRILMIDDDALQLTLTAAMLRQGGVESVCCHTVDELLDELRTHTFDLLLTDLQMPALSGFELVQLLRASNIPLARTLPIVAVTARSEVTASQLSMHGFAGCLHKPFTLSQLLNTLQPIAPVYDLDALTAFSQGDAPASAHIMHTFIAQTRHHAHLLSHALATNNAPSVASLAHKMLPLFVLIKAHAQVESLKWLESYTHAKLNKEAQQHLHALLPLIDDVLAQAETLV